MAAAESIVIPIHGVALGSFRLKATPDRLRGRVTSAVETIMGIARPLGVFVAGLLLAQIGARPTTFLLTAWLVLIAAVTTVNPHVRKTTLVVYSGVHGLLALPHVLLYDSEIPTPMIVFAARYGGQYHVRYRPSLTGKQDAQRGHSAQCHGRDGTSRQETIRCRQTGSGEFREHGLTIPERGVTLRHQDVGRMTDDRLSCFLPLDVPPRMLRVAQRRKHGTVRVSNANLRGQGVDS